MLSTNSKRTLVILAGLLVALLLIRFASYRLGEHQSQLSVKPPRQHSTLTLEAIDSTLGFHASLPYSTLQHAAERATTQVQSGEGEKQTCTRILGAQVCATLHWNYHIKRNGEINFSRNGELTRLTLPLSLNGTAGVNGDSAKLLGLRNKKFDGRIKLHADLHLAIGANWCPVIKSKLSHEWVSDPRISIAGKMKINLRKSADKAIAKKLRQLENQFSELIDCNQFRSQIAPHWKVHQIPIKVPGQQQAFLEIKPLSIGVSQVRPLKDHISVAFELIATTVVVDSQSDFKPQPLPEILSTVTSPGAVEFSVLINLAYTQIQELVSANLLGRIQESDGRTFLVNSFDLYPSDDRLIFDLGFSASGFGKYLKTTGQLYLSARPVADHQANELRFDDLRFTRILDSDLWSLLSAVLHQQILDRLTTAAVIDLSTQVAKLEQSIVSTLADPNNTANIQIDTTAPQVRLVAVNPQADSLAAIVHVSTRINATIPPDVLIKR